MRKTTEWRFLRLLGCSVRLPRFVDLMQMLAYFIATAAAFSLIVSLLYLATFKASDSTYPPRRDSFENVPWKAISAESHLRLMPRWTYPFTDRFPQWNWFYGLCKAMDWLCFIQINFLVYNSLSVGSNCFVTQSQAIHLTWRCWLEIFALIPAGLLNLKSKKLSMTPVLRVPFRLCGWAFELLLVSRIARLFPPTLRAFYVAWSYPSLKTNSYYYNVLVSEFLLPWLYFWLELLNSAVSWSYPWFNLFGCFYLECFIACVISNIIFLFLTPRSLY